MEWTFRYLSEKVKEKKTQRKIHFHHANIHLINPIEMRVGVIYEGCCKILSVDS